MKVLHLLASNKYSGAENMVCQIINLFSGEIEMLYCSPKGEIEQSLKNHNINFRLIDKLSLKQIKQVIKEFKPDIIHAHDLRACVLASKINGIRKIAHIHCNHSQMNKFSLRAIIAKQVFKKFNKIIWVSRESEEKFIFKNKIKDKSLILPNIVSIENINLRKEKATLTQGYDIVYCGRLVDVKNPLRILEIARLLDDNVKIGIIGSGELKPLMQEKIKDFNLEDRVFLLDFIENPFKIIENSKLMIMTSKTEGTPMTALESLCLKTPIISTAVGGMKDLIINNENGFLYETNEEASQIIMELMENEKHLHDLKESTIAFGYNYNNSKNYKKSLMNVYNETLYQEI